MSSQLGSAVCVRIVLRYVFLNVHVLHNFVMFALTTLLYLVGCIVVQLLDCCGSQCSLLSQGSGQPTVEGK